MSVNPIQSTGNTAANNYDQAYTSTVTNKDQSNQFMLMLLAQLQNQSPLSPMDDQQMLGQMTQLNSLQALQAIQTSIAQLTASNQVNNAANLIGKYVTADLGDGKTLQGTVTEVDLSQGAIVVTIGDQTVPIGSIMEIKSGEDN